MAARWLLIGPMIMRPLFSKRGIPARKAARRSPTFCSATITPADDCPSFYKSVDQLPPFTDYSMQGRTYRYFKGEPLFPFGFGLSYTRFKYDHLKLSADRLKAGDELRITAEVQNVGDRAGNEVAKL